MCGHNATALGGVVKPFKASGSSRDSQSRSVKPHPSNTRPCKEQQRWSSAATPLAPPPPRPLYARTSLSRTLQILSASEGPTNPAMPWSVTLVQEMSRWVRAGRWATQVPRWSREALPSGLPERLREVRVPRPRRAWNRGEACEALRPMLEKSRSVMRPFSKNS